MVKEIPRKRFFQKASFREKSLEPLKRHQGEGQKWGRNGGVAGERGGVSPGSDHGHLLSANKIRTTIVLQ